MKTRMIAALLVIAALLPLGGPLDGKEKLHWRTFDEGIAEAQKTGKKVLIDVYTTWCVWCKRMDADTYSDDQVASYLSKHYVLVKLNAESSASLIYKGKPYSEQELAKAFGVSGYPTTVFLKSNGDPITGMPGYAEAGKFRDILAFIGEDHYLTQKFDDYLSKRAK